ncbi:uncharacterized protein LOC136041639 [Artemia franciscana]|uniref:uncharacterized protein LOC136041639 n=1 Tax=Artemia franciscana TaxID=6661 RepID=UPI0032DAF9A2
MTTITTMKQSVYVNLIVLVQNHPCLYDTSNSLYKNTKYKNDRWSEIANSLGEQAEWCKSTWTYLRNQFMKRLNANNFKRSGDGGDSLDFQKWPHFRAMQFLRKYHHPRKTSGNFDNEEDTITIQLSDGDSTSNQPDVKFDETNFGSSSTSSSPIASTASNTYLFQNNLTTSNTFTVFEGDSTANFPHKKNHILTPDSESSTSNFPSALTTSKSNPIIIQPKNPFANTIYLQSSSPTMQYPVAPLTFVQLESPPNPLCSTSNIQNKHASGKSSKLSSYNLSHPIRSSPPFHTPVTKPEYSSKLDIFEPSNSPSVAPTTPLSSGHQKK